MTDTGGPSERAHRLGEFLRARREQVTPEMVGIRSFVRRRVSGLRREELAMLAGLSSDYVMRLEQGRDHRPSERVLKALARALRLDADATAHLFVLGGTEPPHVQQGWSREEHVGPGLQDLLDGWTTTPAFIHGRRLDVLAANRIARALTPWAEPGTNLLRSWFLNHDDRLRHEDVDCVRTRAVAYFRARIGNHVGDPDVTQLVDELSHQSAAFREVWARHDVQSAMTGEGPLYHHPTVGTFHLRLQTFGVDGAEGQALLVVVAPPGSREAQALGVLASSLPDRAAGS